MSENAQPGKPQKAKGLGRGLGSLLGSTDGGAFSKTMPPAEKSLETLTGKLPSQNDPAIREGFQEKKAAPAMPTPKAPFNSALSSALANAKPAAQVATPVPSVAAEPPVPAPTPVAVAPTPAPAPAAPTVPAHMRVWQIPIEKLFPNPNQPRQIFEKEPLQELSNSIREKGIIQPLLVRKSEDDTYEIIAGERRWRAAQLAGLKEVPALLKQTEDREVLELALIENIQRENLNPIEEAEAYDFLVKKYNLTQQELADKVGKDRATVANMLRLLQLQPGVRQMVSRGELSMGQAKVLLSISDSRLQEKLAMKAKSETLSVRALEKLVAKAKISPEAAEIKGPDARTKAALVLGEELQKLLGSKVVLDYDKGKGKIVIHFYSDQELNQIADTLRDSWRP